MGKVKPLSAEQLTCRCDPKVFKFDTTAELESLTEIIGQQRALRALDFGLGMSDHGYNIYVLGETGTGKASTVKASLERSAKDEPVPVDWCYIYNFNDPDRPRALSIPPGMGTELRRDMFDLVTSLKRDIPKVFDSKDYEMHRDEIIEGQEERTKPIFHRLEKLASDKDFILKKGVSGLSITPSSEGKPIGPEEFDKLPKDRREVIEHESKLLQDKLGDAVREARAIDKETKKRIKQLDREVVQYVVNPLITEYSEKYKEQTEVVAYLKDVREDILSKIDDFRPTEEVPMPLAGLKLPTAEPSFERYEVNLVVNNADTRGAPVVVESNPTYNNVFGRLEHRIQYGVATTDFTMIKAGSLLKANGGYLVVNALDVLKNIFVYDALKRTIKDKEFRMEDVWEQYRLITTTTIKPSPIPMDVKIVMVGEPYIYYLLYNLDHEYRKLFKVKADFESEMPRTEENVQGYALFIADRCKAKGLSHFDREGVARVVEYGLRLAGDKEKLSTRFSIIEDIVTEASYYAGVEGDETVTASHVERAEAESVYRNSKIEEKIREMIEEDTLMVDTTGKVAGQVNGLAVLDMGDYAFGKPSRVTATVFMGDSGVVNIEREAKMSGRIYNKAHMILASFLGDRFARRFPLTLSASICFEQHYSGIEGDSATLAEFYGLLSALSGIPINQAIAVTGSMNQRGDVQPIGGVNEKIEGFFYVCKAKGFDGGQGVIIPSRNVKNLLLKKEVRDAVEAGTFSVYPIENVDQGLEILLGLNVGERGEGGKWPEGSVNDLVEKRLESLAKSYKAFGRPKPAKKAKKAADDENDGNDKSRKE